MVTKEKPKQLVNGITDRHVQMWYYVLSWIAASFISLLAFFAGMLFPTTGLSAINLFFINIFRGLTFFFCLLVVGIGIVWALVMFTTQMFHDFNKKQE